jgi:hypothetical protein
LAIKNNDKPTQEACTDLMHTIVKNQRYRLKAKYFNGVAANEVPTTSLVDYMTDLQWKALVAKWTDPENMIWVSCHILLFHIQFAHNLLILRL